jgi:adenylate cyclase class 2
MSLNLELKASIDSLDDARRIALALGAEPGGLLLQIDTYYTAPGGRLKLRVVNGKSAELIGYERGEEEDERWSTYEKTAVSDPVQIHSILSTVLGIRVVVRKRRELYWYEGARIHLDDVEGLGTFLEFEVPSGGNRAAEETMKSLREKFGIRPSQVFRRSYADMIMEAEQKKSE